MMTIVMFHQHICRHIQLHKYAHAQKKVRETRENDVICYTNSKKKNNNNNGWKFIH